MTITIIAARAKNGVIGSGDQLIPWRLRADLVRLKELTAGQTVIIGRKTFQSMAGYYAKSGRPMPAQRYIVLSRRSDRNFDNNQRAAFVASVDEALDRATPASEVFILGGEQIYKQFLPMASRMYLTEVNAAPADGNAFFPEFSTGQWHETERQQHQKDEYNDHDFDWVTFKRA